jgi:hypothetical protein
MQKTKMGRADPRWTWRRRRRLILVSFALLAVVCASAATAAATAAASPPNIVFVMADDLGWGEPGPFPAGSAHGRIDTPHLSRLASQGMRFTNAYAGYTVCGESAASPRLLLLLLLLLFGVHSRV